MLGGFALLLGAQVEALDELLHGRAIGGGFVELQCVECTVEEQCQPVHLGVGREMASYRVDHLIQLLGCVESIACEEALQRNGCDAVDL